jgi:hypothetical protein
VIRELGGGPEFADMLDFLARVAALARVAERPLGQPAAEPGMVLALVGLVSVCAKDIIGLVD